MNSGSAPEGQPRGSGRTVPIVTAILVVLVVLAYFFLPQVQGLEGDFGAIFGKPKAISTSKGGAPGPTSRPSGLPAKSPRPSTKPRPVVAAAARVKIFAFASRPIKTVAMVNTEIAMLSRAPKTVFGIAWRFQWATLEPSPGVYNWSVVDAALAASRAHGRPASILVIPGVAAPAWALGRCVSVVVSNSGLSGVPSSARMCLPWDSTYLGNWEAFVRTLGRRYNGAAGLFAVKAAGGGRIGEMALPNGCAFWVAQGFTNQKLTAAWASIITTFRQAFPGTPTQLGIDEPLVGCSNVLVPIVSFIHASYPSRVYLQQNGLRACYASGCGGRYPGILSTSSFWTVVGYQMFNVSSNASVGSLSVSFHVAVRGHSRYVEVYDSDIVQPSYSGLLRDLAAGTI